jgi:hypothetical protein
LIVWVLCIVGISLAKNHSIPWDYFIVVLLVLGLFDYWVIIVGSVAGHVARMGEERKVYKVLVGKPEGKRPLGRPRRRWEDGIRMHLREIGLGGVDWIRLSQDRTGGGLL